MEEADCVIASFAGIEVLRWRVSVDWARRWGRQTVWATLLRDLVVSRAKVLPFVLRFAEGLQELGLCLAQSGLDDPGARALAERLGELPLLQLKLDLRACPFRSGLAAIAAALPPQLTSLHLTLKGWGYQDSSAEVVAQHLPRGLQSLHLDFGGSRLTGAGAAAIFQRLPEGLQDLELLFFGCALGDGWLPELPKLSLHRLLLNFSGTGLGDAGVAGLKGLLSDELQDLTLHLVSCGVTSRSVSALVLPPLARLSLDLSSTEVTEDGLAGLTLPRTLTTFHLGVAGCEVSTPGPQLEHLPPLIELHYDWGSTKLDAEAASSLVASLPATLQRLHLSLRDVPLGPHGAGLPEHLPLGLKELRLDCTGCLLGTEGASAVQRRVGAMRSLVQEEVLCDAYGADIIISVDEEDLEQGLLGLRANHVHPGLHDAVYLNNHSIFEAGPAFKRRRVDEDSDWCEEYI